MASENISFNVPVDFTGVSPWDPTKGGANDPEPGAYAGRTISAVEYDNDGKKSLKVVMALEGGGEATLFTGLDFSKPSNLQKAAAALLSVGIPAAKLGLVKTLTPAHFMGQDGKGRPCHVLVKLVDGVNERGQKKFNDKEWMTAEQFAAYKSSPAARAAAPTSAAPAAGATPEGDPALGNLFG
jgi:hypothetical protein